MGNFNRGGYRGRFNRDRRSFRGDRQMFKAVCSNCGKDCQVPFRPTGDKPVYCSDCFEKFGGRSEKRSFDKPRRDDRNQSDGQYKIQLESINAKLDKILSIVQPKDIREVSSQAKAVIETRVEKTKTKATKRKKDSKEKALKETEQLS